jgi:hypothetical protein
VVKRPDPYAAHCRYSPRRGRYPNAPPFDGSFLVVKRPGPECDTSLRTSLLPHGRRSASPQRGSSSGGKAGRPAAAGSPPARATVVRPAAATASPPARRH